MEQKDIINLIYNGKKFYDDLKNGNNGRYLSWEYCYRNFHDAREKCKKEKSPSDDIDYLCLQLAFYLASFGMYRGSSFLLQKDYKIHKDAVEEILKPEYDPLLEISVKDYGDENNQKLLMKLKENLNEFYSGVRKSVNNDDSENVSQILITKILLGTMGCTPAYDRNFIKGIKNVITRNFNINSILKIRDFYSENFELLEKVRKNMKIGDLEYPQMRLVDLIFWKAGEDKYQEEKNKKIKK